MELILFAAIFLFSIYQSISLRNLKASIKKSQQKERFALQKTENLLHSIYFSLKNSSLPMNLLSLPLAEETGLLTSIKEVKIPSLSFAYNAAICKLEQNYLLFFRYDTPSLKKEDPKYSHIGSIHLDLGFNPLENTFMEIKTGSLYSEDPRFFKSKHRSFLIYNDRLNPSKSARGMRIAELDQEKTKILSITKLPLFGKASEKNWTPFLDNEKICFLYTIAPPKILTLPNPKESSLHSRQLATLHLDWTNKYGPLRGGTPAISVYGEYLSFFHSSFEDAKGVLWYVMGAYTFNPNAPSFLTRISPHPILFKGVYDTPHHPLVDPKVRAIYPVGLVQDGDKIHVSCGENDSTIKILTFDIKVLFSSMKKILAQ
jgi:predicted GH43/DUF377 family glycosyl hydrolase